MNKLITYPFPVHFQAVLPDKIKIAYMEEGQGSTTLLFIHGLAHSSIGWTRNINGLKKHFHCIAIDLPGNGLSQGSTSYPYSLAFFCRCIDAFIQEKKLKNVYLVGHSMGGQISLLFEHLYPGVSKGLILCAPAGIETFNNWERSLYYHTMFFVDMVSNDATSLRQSLKSSFFRIPNDADLLIQDFVDLMEKQDRKHYRYMMESCIRGMLDEPVRLFFPEIRIPVALIFGLEDTFIPNRMIHPVSVRSLATEARNEFPNARLFLIPHCGHFLQWEKAKTLNNIIEGWITSG